MTSFYNCGVNGYLSSKYFDEILYGYVEDNICYVGLTDKSEEDSLDFCSELKDVLSKLDNLFVNNDHFFSKVMLDSIIRISNEEIVYVCGNRLYSLSEKPIVAGILRHLNLNTTKKKYDVITWKDAKSDSNGVTTLYLCYGEEWDTTEIQSKDISSFVSNHIQNAVRHDGFNAHIVIEEQFLSEVVHMNDNIGKEYEFLTQTRTVNVPKAMTSCTFMQEVDGFISVPNSTYNATRPENVHYIFYDKEDGLNCYFRVGPSWHTGGTNYEYALKCLEPLQKTNLFMTRTIQERYIIMIPTCEMQNGHMRLDGTNVHIGSSIVLPFKTSEDVALFFQSLISNLFIRF